MLATVNGGAVWNQVLIMGGTSGAIDLKDVVTWGDGSNAVAVGDDGEVLLREGGGNFSRLPILPDPPLLAADLAYLGQVNWLSVATGDSGQTLYLGGEGGAAARIDNGVTELWSNPKTFTVENLVDLSFDSGDHGFAVGRQFYVAEVD